MPRCALLTAKLDEMMQVGEQLLFKLLYIAAMGSPMWIGSVALAEVLTFSPCCFPHLNDLCRMMCMFVFPSRLNAAASGGGKDNFYQEIQH